MHWWGYVYMVVFGILSVAGLVDDHRDGCSRLYLLWGVLAAVSAVTMFIAYFESSVAYTVGQFLAVLLVISVTFEITSAVGDLGAARGLSSEDARFVRIGTLLSLLLYAPALVLGSVVTLRSLGLTG